MQPQSAQQDTDCTRAKQMGRITMCVAKECAAKKCAWRRSVLRRSVRRRNEKTARGAAVAGAGGALGPAPAPACASSRAPPTPPPLLPTASGGGLGGEKRKEKKDTELSTGPSAAAAVALAAMAAAAPAAALATAAAPALALAAAAAAEDGKEMRRHQPRKAAAQTMQRRCLVATEGGANTRAEALSCDPDKHTRTEATILPRAAAPPPAISGSSPAEDTKQQNSPRLTTPADNSMWCQPTAPKR